MMERVRLGRNTARARGVDTAPPEFAGEPLGAAAGPARAAKSIARGLTIQAVYAALDVCCVLATGVAAYLARFGEQYTLQAQVRFFKTQTAHEYAGFFVLYAGLLVLCCVSQNLYQTPRERSTLDETLMVIKAVALATALLALFIFVSGNKEISRLVICWAALLNASALSGWRAAKREWILRQAKAGTGLLRVLVVGTGRLGRAVARWLEENRHFGYEVCGFLDSRRTDDPRVLGTFQEVHSVSLANFVDELFITLPIDREIVKHMVKEARRIRLNLKVIPDLYDGLGWQCPLYMLGGFPVMELHEQPIPVLGRAIKRMVDFVVALCGLLICAPLLAILAGLIRLDSQGPAFYVAERVGRKGKKFRCCKLRTMVADADEIKEKLRSINQRRGPFFKLELDPRVTRLGRWLRKLSIDEIPQLYNVLMGDMSLVGPRPHPVDDFERYDVEDLRRLDVKPGLTGLWQVTARSDPSFETNMALDLEYIENWSLWLDLKVLLKTVPAVLRAEGN
jgi:exopolysaccharide biosynthesis polyprenyl glycosylphosphotransferase